MEHTQLKKIRLAIADDHEQLRQAMKTWLVKQGFDVMIGAANGHDLLDQLEKTTTPPDICIMDLNMPLMDGIATIREIRNRDLDMNIIVFAATRKNDQIELALQAGANCFLEKGGHPDDLKRALQGGRSGAEWCTELLL